MVNDIRTREKIINKIKRTSIVVFLKRIFPFLLILIIFVFSLIFGFWDIKRFEFSGSEFNNLSSTQLESYLKDFDGENIFLLSLEDVEEKLLESNGYIKRVYIKKIIPSKLSIDIEEHIPLYIGYSTDSCFIFSKEGYMIEKVCEECKDTCFEDQDNTLIKIVSDQALGANRSLIFFDEFDSLLKVFGEFGYTISEIVIEDGVVEVKDIEGHLFVFDITYDLDIQLARLYLVAKKINSDMIQFKNVDMRFERPVMELR